MPSPTADPKMLQIMDALCAQLATISPATGFYSTVAGSTIEPLTFDNQDTYPQTVVEEDSDSVTDSNANVIKSTTVLRVAGFVQVSSATVMRDALKLRSDITVLLRSLKAQAFTDVDGKQLVNSFQVIGKRDLGYSARNPELLEVAVRVSIDVSDFSTPVVGP